MFSFSQETAILDSGCVAQITLVGRTLAWGSNSLSWFAAGNDQKCQAPQLPSWGRERGVVQCLLCGGSTCVFVTADLWQIQVLIQS